MVININTKTEDAIHRIPEATHTCRKPQNRLTNNKDKTGLNNSKMNAALCYSMLYLRKYNFNLEDHELEERVYYSQISKYSIIMLMEFSMKIERNSE